MKVRLETLEMVNKAIEDPRKRTTDATILAVMNLLFSEIMGCDGATMLIHQQGLHNLVQQRGGLHSLGGSGQLACTLAMYVSLIAHALKVYDDADILQLNVPGFRSA